MIGLYIAIGIVGIVVLLVVVVALLPSGKGDSIMTTCGSSCHSLWGSSSCGGSGCGGGCGGWW